MPVYLDILQRELDQVVQGLLGDLAEEGAEIARQEARRDTGFYGDHIRFIRPGQPGLAPDSDAEGHSAPGTSGAPPDEAHVIGQANYSIYPELQDNTIMKAVSQLPGRLEDIASKYRI